MLSSDPPVGGTKINYQSSETGKTVESRKMKRQPIRTLAE